MTGGLNAFEQLKSVSVDMIYQARLETHELFFQLLTMWRLFSDNFTLLRVLVSAGVGACTNILDHRLLDVDGMRDPRKINKVLVVIIIFMTIYHVTQLNPHKRITRLCQAYLGNLSSTDTNYHIDVKGAEKISQDDIYVSIKTTGKFHASRVALILKTWWDGIKKQARGLSCTVDYNSKISFLAANLLISGIFFH